MPHTVKTLKRSLKQLQAQEALVATWLLRIGLALALASWAWEQRANLWTTAVGKGARSARGRKAAEEAGKKAFVWVGGAMGVVRLAVRFYFQRKRRVLDDELLELEPVKPDPKKKKSKKLKA
ncbi:hypothetical protein JCM6882_006785 [Rhodosporidiobolus microsporus]